MYLKYTVGRSKYDHVPSTGAGIPMYVLSIGKSEVAAKAMFIRTGVHNYVHVSIVYILIVKTRIWTFTCTYI